MVVNQRWEWTAYIRDGSSEYHIADFDPVAHARVVQDVQGQQELSESVKYLEDLLLSQNAQVRWILVELAKTLEKDGQKDLHGFVVRFAVLERLVPFKVRRRLIGQMIHKIRFLDKARTYS